MSAIFEELQFAILTEDEKDFKCKLQRQNNRIDQESTKTLIALLEEELTERQKLTEN